MSKIAITGIACRFPAAKNYQEFWQNLYHGVNSIQQIPIERWDIKRFYSPNVNEADKSNSKWCGIVEDIDKFDNRFFNISPREANNMDPQQRLLLEEAWHCIEDSGISLKQLQDKTTAVFVGVMANDYQQYASENQTEVDSYGGLGNYTSILANRLSYTFGFSGISSTINAACASSLVALHEAKQALLNNECDYALVAGVNLNLHPWKYISFSKSRMLSPDGQCKTFDQEANGYVPGDGVGVILLQKLASATAEKSHIYGLICGSALNHNGQNLSMTAPNVQAQRDLILNTYQQADFSPETVSYVEAHGTGTSLGDPIEVESLTQAFYHGLKSSDKKQQYCQIGSVKSNIGHLEGAAGIAGIIKVLLMMQHQYIPRSLNIKTLNPIIDFKNSPFQVAVESGHWSTEDAQPMRAGVSSFGFGGVNSHVLLEQASIGLQQTTDDIAESEDALPFLLTAKNPQALEKVWALWQQFLTQQDQKTLAFKDIFATLATARKSHSARFGILLKNSQELYSLPKQLDTEQLLPAVKQWQLQLGDCTWTGWKQVPQGLKNDALFQSKLTEIRKQLKNLDTDLDKGLKQSSWKAERRAVYSFVVAKAMVEALLTAGFETQAITCIKGGDYLALNLSGVISTEAALSVLAGISKVEDIILQRPSRLFFNPNSQRLCFPVQFSQDYLQQLMDKLLQEEDLEVIKQSVNKARLLIQHQYTFKRYLDEWDTVLKELKLSVTGLLADDTLIAKKHKPESQQYRHLLLLLVIVNSALFRLNQKWSLTDSKPFNDARFYELIGLINDGVICKENLLELCMEPQPKLQQLTEQLNQQAVTLQHNHPYQLLATFNQRFAEISNLSDWLNKLPTENKQVLEKDSALLCFNNSGFQIKQAQSSSNFAYDLKTVLLQLWCRGVDVDWSLYYPVGSFFRQALPVYPFDSKPFWLKTKKVQDIPTPEPVHQQETENKEIACYRLQWQQQALSFSSALKKDQCAIFFMPDENSALASDISYQQVYKIYAGKNFTEDKDLKQYHINSENEADYSQLFNSILVSKPDNCDLTVFYMLAGDKEQTLDNYYKQLKNVFYLTKALASLKMTAKINLLLGLYDGHVVVDDDKASAFAYTGLYGLAQSLMLENRKFHIQMVDFSIDEAQAFKQLQIEHQYNNSAGLIAYRGGHRYSRQPVKTEIYFNGILVKPSHVYLVVGGLGGLGLQVIEYLLKTKGIKLAVLGRSAVNEEKKLQIQKWNQSGSELIYLPTDIGNRKILEQSLQNIRNTLGNINGVIHCGGILDDKLLVNKTWDSFSEVLKPKISGAWLLNELTHDEPLDFFALFSSVVAVTGNLGQTDYATANGFLDGLIHYRRQQQYPGQSLTVNWTLWEDGGMGLTDNIRLGFAKRSGIIESSKALPLFFNLLGSTENQIIVAEDNDFFDQTVNVTEQLDSSVKQMLAEILHINDTELDSSTSFDEYGLDKVALVDFIGKINQHYGLMLNPALLLEITTLEALAAYITEQGIVEIKEMEPVLPVPAQQSRAENSEAVKTPLRNWLLENLANVLDEEAANLEMDVDIREFGLDSITLTSYAETIDQALGVHFDAALLFQLSTVEEIADYLIEQAAEKMAAFFNINRPSNEPIQQQSIIIDKTVLENHPRPIKPQPVIPTPSQIADIAIIGISGRFPGADNVEDFWQNLIDEQDMISEIPESRWDWREYFGDLEEGENKTVSKWGGFLNNVDSFDADFFNITAHEAELMDPQQRLLLEEVWHTIEDAGYKPSALAGSNSGVFVGVCNDDYVELIQQSGRKQEALVSTGEYFTIIPNRISYQFDFHGPSLAFDAACSSSLVAINQAIQSIQNGDCELAFAAGVNVCLSPRRYFYFSDAGMLSPDGRCKTFDKSANGYVRGEGVGVVMLKSLQQAEADADHIYGVIKSSVVNHGGRANTLTAPNPNAQAKLCVDAYQKANIAAQSIGYIETHGTGTQLGDSIEVNGLKTAFKQLYQQQGQDWSVNPPETHCGLGSVKTNIGHLETAAGMASLFKVLQAIKYKTIPATLHFKELNPYIQLEKTPFYIVDKQTDWQQAVDDSGQKTPRRAGISSFGFGGNNAHTVIEEYINKTTASDDKAQIFVLSAKTTEQLKQYAQQLAVYLSTQKQYLRLSDIAWTLQIGREEMDERLAVVASSFEELEYKLKRYYQSKDSKPNSDDVFFGNSQQEKDQLGILLDGEAGRAYVEISIKNQELSKLAGLWVKGISFEWQLLHNQQTTKRCPLPTYLFAKQKHWVQLQKTKTKSKDDSKYARLDQEEYETYYQDYGLQENMLAFLKLIKK